LTVHKRFPTIARRGPLEPRRADRRYDRRIPIEISFEGRTHAAETRNISLGGVFIATALELPFGARVGIRFALPTQVEPVEVDGQVRWRDAGPQRPGLGVRFDGLRARDVWALNKFFGMPESDGG